MALSNPEIIERLTGLTEPRVRGRLLARGLARSLVWRDGKLPPDAPAFAESLSHDLESHAFHILALALSVSGEDRLHATVTNAFRVAAEALEAVVRRGNGSSSDHGFFTVVCAAAYQLARLGARSHVMLPPDLEALRLSVSERIFASLLRRDFNSVTGHILKWANSATSDAEEISQRLDSQNVSAGTDDDLTALALSDEGIAWIITDNYVRAISFFDLAIRFFDHVALEEARRKFERGRDFARTINHVPLWWIHELTLAVIDDLWKTLIWNVLPKHDGDAPASAEWNRLRHDYIRSKVAKARPELDVWPSQLEAARLSAQHDYSMVVALPTSAGKTKIAELCILRCLSLQKRVFYITPLRALSAQAERLLSSTFRPLGFTVTSLYGASGVSKIDIDIAQEHNIVVATPEKLDYVLRNAPETLDDVGLVVLDEGHMIGIGVREVRYETLVQRMLKRGDSSERRIICLSAIFSGGESFDDFVSWISRGNSRAAVCSQWRPTRQRGAVCSWQGTSALLRFYVDGEEPYVPRYIVQRGVGGKSANFPSNRNQLVVAITEKLIDDGHTVLVYCPLRKSVGTMARVFLNLVRSGAVKFPVPPSSELREAMSIGREWLGDEHLALLCLQAGIAIHHGALPRPLLAEVERLINSRQIKVIVASPTLAQGLDLCCSAMVFQSLYRNGSPITENEFTNVIGRVGRAFVDIEGLCVFPAFENERRKQEFRINEFRSLWARSHNRTLESGLLQLVNRLFDVLATKLNAPLNEIVEIVTNIDFDWRRVASNPDEDDLSTLIAQLDEALLTIIAPEADVMEVARLLDDALQHSYWQRRVSRIADPEVQVRQQRFLTARARWIWSHSDASMRRGFSTAGVGLATGESLLAVLAALAPLLLAAEEAIGLDDVESAITAMIPLVENLAILPTFKTKLPEQWQRLLRQWMLGNPVWEKGGHCVGNGFGIYFRRVGIPNCLGCGGGSLPCNSQGRYQSIFYCRGNNGNADIRLLCSVWSVVVTKRAYLSRNRNRNFDTSW